MSKSSLLRAIKGFDPNDPTERSRIQELLSRKLTFATLSKDVKGEVPNARESLAMYIRTNAASDRDVMLDVREIKSGDQYLMSNNETVDIALRGLIDGTWSVRSQPNQTTINIYNEGTNENITLGGERTSEESKLGKKANTRMAVYISKGLLKRMNILKKAQLALAGVGETVKEFVGLLKQLLKG